MAMVNKLFGNRRNVTITALVIIVAVCFVAYYLIVLRNSEGFFVADANKAEPKLTPDPSECVVALFYADWCPHCKSFKPIFQKAKEMMEQQSCTAPELKGKKLRFVPVDCEAYPALAKQYSVNGYPTVKLITSDRVFEYDRGRDLDSMNNYFFPN